MAAPVNDAYRYEDEFSDNTGISLLSTGFANIGGLQTALAQVNELVSNCFELSGPVGSVFTGWSFAEFNVPTLPAHSKNEMLVESCDGSTQYLTNNLSAGTSAFDMSAVPVSANQLRFRWAVKYQGTAGPQPVQLSMWRALGTSTGATGLQIVPTTTAINSNSDVSFQLGISSKNVTKNPLLKVDLNELNGTPGVGVSGIGLATDATVCYDLNNDGVAGSPASECDRYRPIEFRSASDGPAGEPADITGLSQPAKVPASGGQTDGEIIWSLNDLSDGFAGTVSVTLHVPKGYIDAKTLALAATLEFGESSADGTLDNYQSVAALSSTIMINSLHNGQIRGWSPYNNTAPGTNNIYDNFYLRNRAAQDNNPSDLENVTVEIRATNASTCVPVFRSASPSVRHSWPYRVDKPVVGAPLDANPVTTTYFRTSYISDSSNARTIIRYDVPSSCVNGEIIRTQATATAVSPSINHSHSLTHNVVFEACRSGYNHLHRIQSGLSIGNDFQPTPAWPEYYINRGSVKPGEYFSSWSPYGSGGYRWNTIVLDKTYALFDVPESITFHGYRIRFREDLDSQIFFFKDPTGTAPGPVDPGFDNDFDPVNEVPATGWFRIANDWTGPFTQYTGTAADNNNPNAVIAPGARIMMVKTNDNTASGASDYGMLRSQAVWRMCDGSYNCSTPLSNSLVRVTGSMYTYQQLQTPFARHCADMSGYSVYSEAASFPKVYAAAEQQNVLAGGVASVVLTPHNSNLASQYVDGRWAFDLSSVVNDIDVNNVTGEVLSAGLNFPEPNQNIAGQSCNPADITFVAPTTTNPIAYWDIPPQCQIPNGWGHRIPNNNSQDNYVPAYQLKLNVPIWKTTLAGTVLNIDAQIRSNDLAVLGADNAVTTSRWAASNYEVAVPITVLENPAFSVVKTGPAGWPVNSTFSYVVSLANQGNTPLYGYYLVDELPRTGVNGSEFDPEYGAVFLSQSANDILFETSVDSTCYSDSFNATWSVQTLQASNRAGYQSETDVLDASTHCIRLRRASGGPPLGLSSTTNMAVDITIPDDVFLSGLRLFNKAQAGVSDVFGGTSNMSATETALVSTIVDGAVVLGASKSTTASLSHNEQIGWHLGYQNTSGTVANSVTVTDTLPDTVIYQGLLQALPVGVSCTNGTNGDINNDGIVDCALVSVNPDGSGGTLELTVDELTPDDGNPASGTDQGEVGIWTVVTVNQLLENCVNTVPAGGVAGNACTTGQLSQATAIKTQIVADNRAGVVPDVYFGESIQYTLNVKNEGAVSRYLKLRDQLPSQVAYIAGSLTVGGASASDNLFSANKLEYVSPVPVAPGEQLTISFTTDVVGGAVGEVVVNDAVFMMCADRTTNESCEGARTTDSVQATIKGSRIFGSVFNDNGTGASVAHDGQQSSAEAGAHNINVSLVHIPTDSVVSSTQSQASGQFELYAPLVAGQQYQLKVLTSGDWLSVSHNNGNIQAIEQAPNTLTLTFDHVNVSDSYDSVRFGLVERPVLLQAEVRTLAPGESILIPHSYQVTTSGQLQFDLTEAMAVTSLNGWHASLYEDADCDQTLSATEAPLVAPISVDPDIASELCVIFRLHAPDQIGNSMQLHVPIVGNLILSDAAGTGHNVTYNVSVVDTLDVILGNTGSLVLQSKVKNMTQAGAIVTANQAYPGEVLRYHIDFEVRGGSSINNVNVYERTPAFTELNAPVACPPSVANCVVVVPAAAQNTSGYSGPLQWQLDGTIPSGTSGQLIFEVRIDE